MGNRKFLPLEALREPRIVTGAGLLVAMAVVVDFFRIVLSPTMEITLGGLPLAVAGIVYGPIIGGVVGIVTDILQYLARPNGPYFPGFTINAMLIGVIFGYLCYGKKVTWGRLALCLLIEGGIITFFLTPLWLQLMYGTKILMIPRVIKFLGTFPIKLILLYYLWQFLKGKLRG